MIGATVPNKGRRLRQLLPRTILNVAWFVKQLANCQLYLDIEITKSRHEIGVKPTAG